MTLSTFANNARRVNATPATAKQIAYMEHLISEKNTSLSEMFSSNSNVVLTSSLASEMIAQLIEMPVQAPKATQAETSEADGYGYMNENGEYLNFNGDVTERALAGLYSSLEEAQEDLPYAIRDRNIPANATVVAC